MGETATMEHEPRGSSIGRKNTQHCLPRCPAGERIYWNPGPRDTPLSFPTRTTAFAWVPRGSEGAEQDQI